LVVSYFLANLGYSVSLYDKESNVGGSLSREVNKLNVPKDVLDRELSSLLLPNIHLNYNTSLGGDIKIEDLSGKFDAVYIAFEDPTYTAGDDMKAKRFTNVFTSYPMLSQDKKEDFSPIIGLAREAVQKIDDFIRS
jgi:NADPH-dependent glutamate synthase beta subunit-like oxidoreductase